MAELAEWERFGIRIAMEAGQMMSAAYSKAKKVDTKSNDTDLVTETDVAVEQYLFGQIKATYPGHKTIGEESTSAGAGEPLTDLPTWMIDPIDGTMNFVHSNPFTCVSIGVTVKKELVLGIVYSPFLNKLYTAKLGGGAFCNGRPIRVTPCEGLSKAMMICGAYLDADPKKTMAAKQNFDAFLFNCHAVRDYGSCAINVCFIAEGAADGTYGFGIHCWDMAACAVILREAGGTIVDSEGGTFDVMSRRFVAAGSAALAAQISAKLVVHVENERD
ncbi:Inositol monophosphatase 1 [Halotydeus destructor]|nr:Inositol monophosphatase 1 [Halotydeus destructor]